VRRRGKSSSAKKRKWGSNYGEGLLPEGGLIAGGVSNNKIAQLGGGSRTCAILSLLLVMGGGDWGNKTNLDVGGFYNGALMRGGGGVFCAAELTSKKIGEEEVWAYLGNWT